LYELRISQSQLQAGAIEFTEGGEGALSRDLAKFSTPVRISFLDFLECFRNKNA